MLKSGTMAPKKTTTKKEEKKKSDNDEDGVDLNQRFRNGCATLNNYDEKMYRRS